MRFTVMLCVVLGEILSFSRVGNGWVLDPLPLFRGASVAGRPVWRSLLAGAPKAVGAWGLASWKEETPRIKSMYIELTFPEV